MIFSKSQEEMKDEDKICALRAREPADRGEPHVRAALHESAGHERQLLKKRPKAGAVNRRIAS